MVDIVKQDMTYLWAIGGDVVAPDNAKIQEGWAVEVVPRQWWNWMQYRTDSNIAYMLQKGLPEWDGTTEYLANKSFVTVGGVVYKCIVTNTNKNPTTNPANWVRAFSDYSVAVTALGTLTPAADRMPYFTGANTAALTTITSFARTLLDDTSATTARTTLGAQASSTNLTALSGVTAATNALPYFNGTTTMATTTLSAFGRSLIDDADAAAARETLELGSSATYNVNGTSYGNTAVGGLGTTVLRNGSFGLGSIDLQDQPAGTNWNTINATGFYQMSTAGGDNSPGLSGQMMVMTNATNYITQLFSPQDTTGRLMVRSSSAGVFGDWNTVWTTGNLVKTTTSADPTPGSILKVGDFGLGVGGTASAPQLLNIDSLTVPSGTYSVRGSAATTGTYPPGVSSYGIMVVDRYNQDAFSQTYTPLVGATGVTSKWVRSYNAPTGGSGWSDWERVAEYSYVDSKVATLNSAINLKANIASPSFTGTPTAPTAVAGTQNNQLATTAFVQAAKRNFTGSVLSISANTTFTISNTGILYQVGADNLTVTLPAASTIPVGNTYSFRVPSTRGTVFTIAAPSIVVDGTASVTSFTLSPNEWVELTNNSSSWYIADRGLLTEAATAAEVALKANTASPAFTGVPTTPTAATATSNTQIASTAFVKAAIAAGNALSATTAARWTTGRTITLTGDVTGSVSIDGSANVSLAATLNSASLTNFYTKAQSDGRYVVNGATGSNLYVNVTNNSIPTISAATASFGSNSLRVSNGGNGNASAVLSFVREGTYATWFGLDTDNELAFGGWSDGAIRYRLWTEKNFVVGNHIALQGTGGIGTYALMAVGGGGGINPGDLAAGGNLRYSSTAASVSGAVPVGTWRLMGFVTNSDGSSSDSVTLCLRIS
ncbi:tail fiber protein [Pseudomonas phage vB_PpuM-NoPa]|uniref:Tail fiber protein n=1 Tax=Pseudomonas phage vB_PpuM-NoPa TaxID=3132619 RepID=A0AAX4MY73_9CAUD